jgi:hypothetical protein
MWWGWREIYKIYFMVVSEGISPLRKIGVNGSMILKCVLRK